MTEHLAHDPYSPHGGPLNAAPVKPKATKKSPKTKAAPDPLPPVTDEAPPSAADALAALDALRKGE